MRCMLCKSSADKLVRLSGTVLLQKMQELVMKSPSLNCPTDSLQASFSHNAVNACPLTRLSRITLIMLIGLFELQAAEFLSQHVPTTTDCGSQKPAVPCLELLQGFEHDLRKSADVQESLDGKQPKDIAKAVYKLYKQAEYVRFTIRMDAATTPAATTMVAMRQSRVPLEWWGPHTAQLVDLHNTTMMFLAKSTCFTPPHADWADAHNIAFAIAAIKVCMASCCACSSSHLQSLHDACDAASSYVFSKVTLPVYACLQGQKEWQQHMPLAKWVFFHPACVARAHAWVMANINKTGFSRDANGQAFHLKEDHIAKLQVHLGEDPKSGEAYVRVVYQFHGERMYVPAGWVHQVENLQDCVKLAWDFFASPERLAVCVAAWQHVHAKIPHINAADYLYAAAVLCQAVQEL